ncbi:MAG: hypothetical protein ACLFV3_09490 [Phycisphaeraceae bacterium]
MSLKRLTVLAGMLIATAVPAFAFSSAQADGARIVTRDGPDVEPERIPLRDPVRRDVYVVRRPVAEPAAVVPERIAEQPVYTHLVELQVVNTPILIDPDRDFVNKYKGGLDEGHSLVEAQRIWRARQARPARIIRNPAFEADSELTPRPRPSMIIDRPDLSEPQPEPMPVVPEQKHPDAAPLQVARQAE